MTPPATVVVAGQTFAVEVAPRATLDGAHGRTNGVTQRIRIAQDNGPDAQRETLMHEVLHAVRMLAALPRREREVRVLGVQLVEVMRRNPALVGFLMDEVQPCP